MDVWRTFRQHFDTDDGSLPEFLLDDPTSAGIVPMAVRLAACKGEVAGAQPATACCRTTKQDLPIHSPNDLPQIAHRVIAGELESPHVVLRRCRIGAIELPDLGVFISQDQIGIDYRMGHEWSQERVRAMLDLLAELLACALSIRLRIEGMPKPEQFMSNWRKFIQTHHSFPTP